MAEERKKLTREGYEKLESELNFLKTTKRDEISAQIAVARGFGDLSENAEYDEARKDQARNEAKIAEIEEILRTCEIVEEASINTDVVGLGNSVTIMNVENEKQIMKVSLVSANEVNAKEFKISSDSPIGNGLMGKHLGEVVEIVLPKNNIVKYKITNIER